MLLGRVSSLLAYEHLLSLRTKSRTVVVNLPHGSGTFTLFS